MQFLSVDAPFALPRVQFRLRSLVIGMSIVAVALAPVRAEIARCQSIQSLVNVVSAQHGELYFDYQLIEEGAVLRQLESSQPSWIRSTLGAHAFAQVIEVRLDQQPISDEILGKIARICPKLAHLSLRSAQANCAQLSQIASCKSLTQLDLSGNPISDAAVDFLGELTCLETLCLEDTQIDGDCFDLLVRLPELKNLTLVNSPVTDESLKKLANSPSIELLFLAGSQITDESIPTIAQMKNLKSVSLNRTKVSRAGRERLKLLCPQLAQS